MEMKQFSGPPALPREGGKGNSISPAAARRRRVGRWGAPRAPPRASGEAGGRSSGRWRLRGATRPPLSARTHPERRAARGGRRLPGFVAAARAAGPGRPGARCLPGAPSPRPCRRAACERSRGRPRSPAPPPVAAAAAGRRLPGRAAAGRGRGCGARAGRAGTAGGHGGLRGRAAATPAPQAGRPAACARRGDPVNGVGLRRTKPAARTWEVPWRTRGRALWSAGPGASWEESV